ncbi:MAG: hypothetical protein ICV63_13140 [Coleofasciculus sp. Co-bin14]|nr:hypothetical protein [Coleofasciculus sp. Co-bin14]
MPMQTTFSSFQKMPEETTLIYPTLELFLYDIREGLGQHTLNINDNRKYFWQRIYSKLQNNSSTQDIQDETFLEKLKEAEKSEANYIELLGSDIVKHFERPLEGYYHPVLIGDTYALRVNCSGVYADGVRQSNYKPQLLKNLHGIQEEIISHINRQPGTIGQTWMMWGQLTDVHQNPTQIALECYKQLAPNPHNWERDLKTKGQFLGGTLFELWCPPSEWSAPEKLSENYHLLIWLFPPNQSINSVGDSIAEIYLDLLHLFCYRNKALWAYGQSCQIAAKLKTETISIQTTIRNASQLPQQKTPSDLQMKRLREVLSHSLTLYSRYAANLSDLSTLGRIIEINLENYAKQLTILEKVEARSNLQFLAEFGEFAAAKYLRQIEMEHTSLSYGLPSLENLIRTVEGVIATYQTQSDRALNSTIAAASVGLATSAVLITSTVAANVLVSQAYENKDTVSFQSIALGVSLLAGALASLIAWKIFHR